MASSRTLLGLSVQDCTSGYRAYARRVLEAVDPLSVRSSGYSFLEEMLYRAHRAGFRVAEVPIVFQDRTAGASKIVTAAPLAAGRAPVRSRRAPRGR